MWRVVLLAVVIVLVFGRWAACFVEGEVCYYDSDCDDGNECIKNYCKDVFEFCEAEYDDSGRCRSSLRPDGTECIPPGKGAGSCQDGLCIPLDGGISRTGGQAPP